MAYHQNQHYYGATNQPSSPNTHPGHAAPDMQPPSGPDGNRDTRTQYGQPTSPIYGGYAQAGSGSYYSAQAQMSGPRPRPPYPTYPYDDHAVGGSQQPQQQQYQYQPAPSPQSSYNPQHYAQTSPSAPFSPPHSLGPPVPPRPYSSRPPPPQPYNPAAYSPALGQQSNIGYAVNQMYGPVNGAQPQFQTQYSSYSYPSMAQQPQQQQPASANYQFNQFNQQLQPQPSAYPTQQYIGSAPLPSRPFPPAVVHPPPTDSRSVHSASTNTPPGYSPHPAPIQSFATSQQRPAQPFVAGGGGPFSSHHQQPQSATSPIHPSSYGQGVVATQVPHEQSDWSRRSIDRTDTSGRHPQSRPLPGPPDIEPDSAPTYTAEVEQEHYDLYGDDFDQDQLFDELENAVGGGSRPSSEQARIPTQDGRRQSSTGIQSENWTANARVNGLRASQDSSRSRNRYGDYSDDGDAEADAGVEAMALAAEEEERAEQRRRQSQTSAQSLEIVQHAQEESRTPNELESDEENYGMYDIGSYSGGINVSMSYGGDANMLVTSLPQDDSTKLQAQHPSTSSQGSMVRSIDGHPIRSSSNTSLTDFSGHSSLPTAHVDQSGTGGLADPSLYSRRMSFDDSSENISIDEQTTAGADMSAGPPDLPYSTSVSMNRPLPPTPQPEDTKSRSSSIYSSTSPSLLYAPDAATLNQPVRAVSPYVPRSTSLLSHPSTPRPAEPVRAKTDGKRQGLRVSTYNVDMPTDAFGIQTPAHVGLDIPSLPPGRRFHPSKLSQRDFDSCTEPWAMSGISSWLRAMAEGESELREHAIVEGLISLFTAKVPNMNITIAEGLAANTLAEMFRVGVLVHEEEWLKFGQGSVTGVLYQLTGKGCYSSYLHTQEISGRCYAPHCQTMVKKINLQTQRTPQTIDWATSYNLSKEDLAQVGKKEIELQNNLHEVVTSEDSYMDQLHVLTKLYRDGLKTANPAIIAPQKLPEFLREVFGKLDAVKAANEEHLLPQLKYRQQEQGPWITGFSDIFRHWIRKAKTAYIEYASNFPNANFLMKREEGRNSMFATFVEAVRSNKLSNRLEWSSFLRAPITRLQRYSLLLSTIQKHTPAENTAELSNLQLALEEIRAVTMECDSKVAESGRKADLYELDSKLILRPEMKGVELNLNQHGRKILFRGDLQRTGGSRFTWLQTHTILLDNYLVLAKTVTTKDSNGCIWYDISKMPIPMDLLVLESANDDPVERSYRGISAVAPAPSDTRTNRSGSTVTTGTLSHTTTNSSISTVDSSSTGKTIVTTTILGEGGSTSDSKILYPFHIKHLGREMYTLYANSAEVRKTWCDKIIEAKAEHATSLYAQNAEPFKLRVMADSAFAYDTWSGGQKSVLIKGSPLGRAVHEVEKMYDHKGRPGPICRARVNCATTFLQPHGTQMVAVGTDYGVYITERGSPRGWSRYIPVLKVTQVAALEEFNLFLLISDKALIAYHLDVVCPPSGIPANSDSVRKAPQKLSGSRDVAFFVTAKMKDRTLIFYKKGSMSSTFKILEPILQRAPEKKNRSILNRGNTMSFRDYDDFYIPAECTALDVFTSTLAVATSKGLETLNLDKKTTFSVPDLKAPHVATIAARLSGVTPLAMFRLNELEFLCVYESCAVYVNKHGDISRSVVMEFVGKAKAAALEGGYLILFDQDFIEIRNAQAGSLKQVIAGRDIRCLDNGRGRAAEAPLSGGGAKGSRSVKFALQHPEQERTQIVVELLLDETRRL